MDDVSSRDDVFSLPVQRSKEYLEALAALGGGLDAIEEARLAYDDDRHGQSGWGGPRPIQSNFCSMINYRACRRVTHKSSD